MTRGRAWIAVLGVLLVGIVALNVVTLSFAASSGKIDAADHRPRPGELDPAKAATPGAPASARPPGGEPLGLAMPSSEDIHFTEAGPDDVATAAQRLAAAGPG